MTIVTKSPSGRDGIRTRNERSCKIQHTFGEESEDMRSQSAYDPLLDKRNKVLETPLKVMTRPSMENRLVYLGGKPL